MCLAPVIRLEEARKLSPAQVLPWVSRNKFRPEGAGNADAVPVQGFGGDPRRIRWPLRAV
jgi:hypothetical protein